MTMNGREKVLVTLLVTVIILLGGFMFLIRPEIKAFSDVKAQLNNAISNKKTAELNIKREAAIYGDNIALKTKINTGAESFFSELRNDQIQSFFNDIGRNVGLTYTMFSMTSPVATQIINDSPQDASLSYQLKDVADQIEKIEKNKAVTPETEDKKDTPAANSQKQGPPDSVEMMQISMQFQLANAGANAKLNQFLDAIKNSNKTVRITSAKVERHIDGTYINITAECYGVKKFMADAN